MKISLYVQLMDSLTILIFIQTIFEKRCTGPLSNYAWTISAPKSNNLPLNL